ncbi:MAG TPA: hypothetical protein VHS28_00075 [Chloroflexota bacterium]|nr:hypothetical protein [Chloroflexota bacterium]
MHTAQRHAPIGTRRDRGLVRKMSVALILSSTLLLHNPAAQPATAAPSFSAPRFASTSPLSEAEDVWSGTLTYNEHTQLDEGSGGENGSSHTSKMTSDYDAAVQVDTLKGSEAQVRAGMTITSRDLTVERIGCPRGWLQEPDWREMRSEGSEDIDASASGSFQVDVSVAIEGESYTLLASFPKLENGTMSIKGHSSITGACGEPTPPTDGSESGPWETDGREMSVEGKLDPNNPDTISGQKQLNEYTSVNWNLTRRPNPCAEIEKQIESSEQKLDELRDEVGAKMGVLSTMSAGAIAEVAGAAPEMAGTAAGPLTAIPAALESADGAESADYLESMKGTLEGPIVTGGEGSLIALTQMAPLPQLQSFLSALQDLKQTTYQAVGELELLKQLQSQLEECQSQQGQ